MLKRIMSAAIALCMGAIALPADAVEVYKDSSGAVYISGLQPSELIKVAYGGVSNKIQVRPTGTCNYLKLPYKASEPGFYPWNEVNLYPSGDTTPALTFTGNDLATVNIAGKSVCDGAGRNESLSWDSLGSGVYGLKDAAFSAVYIVGMPYKIYEAKDGQAGIRLQKANSCGFLKLASTPRWPGEALGTFYFYANSHDGGNPSSDYDSSSLATQAPHLCYKGILYTPAPAI